MVHIRQDVNVTRENFIFTLHDADDLIYSSESQMIFEEVNELMIMTNLWHSSGFQLLSEIVLWWGVVDKQITFSMPDRITLIAIEIFLFLKVKNFVENDLKSQVAHLPTWHLQKVDIAY